MSDDTPTDGLRDRLARSGEDALARLAQEILENPLITAALGRAVGAREKAAQAQEVAMGALNIPSAADIERLTRRVRSVSQRLEAIEDGVDRVDERFAAISGASALDTRLASIEKRLAGIEKRIPSRRAAVQPAKAAEKLLEAIDQRLVEIADELAAVRQALPDEAPVPVSRDQERLEVERGSETVEGDQERLEVERGSETVEELPGAQSTSGPAAEFSDDL